MRRFGSSGIWRATSVLLVALALAMRLATPTGWMLAAGDGAPKLVICTGHAPASPASVKHAPSRNAPAPADHACVFAGAHAASPPPVLAILVSAPAPIGAPLHSAAVRDQRPGLGLAAPPPPPLGPPISA
jgi:hypothetical protein